MIPYPKIESVFIRDEKTHKVLEGQYRQEEVYYLRNNLWVVTEKIDGTNIRVMWDGEQVRFGGRTDNAAIPANLLARLQDLFPVEKFQAAFPDTAVCLYGEGFGAKIQKGGGLYIPDGTDFRLFDVMIGGWWLKWEDVEDIAGTLVILPAPSLGLATLTSAVLTVQDGLNSQWPGVEYAEGIVARPQMPLLTRRGDRIMVKIKHADFRRD